jgi:hypothetical protein
LLTALALINVQLEEKEVVIWESSVGSKAELLRNWRQQVIATLRQYFPLQSFGTQNVVMAGGRQKRREGAWLVDCRVDYMQSDAYSCGLIAINRVA